MSTKVSIKWRDHTDAQPGFHLYEDAFDSFMDETEEVEPPVYLRLDGVSVQLETTASFTVTLKDMAFFDQMQRFSGNKAGTRNSVGICASIWTPWRAREKPTAFPAACPASRACSCHARRVTGRCLCRQARRTLP